MMEGKRTFQKIKLENFLSFGDEGQELELQPLNVLIGPNASGKSNLIEAFRILAATPRELEVPFRNGGGIAEYLWKGAISFPVAKIDVTLDSPDPLSYRFGFTTDQVALRITDEVIADESVLKSSNVESYDYFYPIGDGSGKLRFYEKEGSESLSKSQDIRTDPKRSVLNQVRDPVRFPKLAQLEFIFSNIQFYGDLNLSRVGPVRIPQRTDLPTDILLEDASNLGLILNNYSGKIRQKIADLLKPIYENIEEIHTVVRGNTVQILIHEKGLGHPITTLRLSEGTLRYLCLLTLLNQPQMPPLLCIEEPEAGLHPHAIPRIAELLIEASQKTQLIVTTHSDALISGLTEVPESIIVCERDQDGSHLRRLDPEQIKPWLDKYALGDLWRMGEIGGTR